ncbi:MAG: hypothetical protein GXO75_09180 [Calditrichaeota bacterium]|nr:hypothetical protein [Calditrichota bacterium]
MFRFLSFIGLLLTCGWLAVALKSRSIGLAATGERLRRAGQNIVVSIGNFRSLSSVEFSNKLLFPLTAFCVLVMALTGFIPVVFFGTHMSGYILMLHVATSSLFALCIALAGILWAHKHRFEKADWQVFRALFSRNADVDLTKKVKSEFWNKVCFWSVINLSVLAISSIVASMYKIFGTHGQELLLQFHRYSTLLLIVLATIYTFLVKVEKQ